MYHSWMVEVNGEPCRAVTDRHTDHRNPLAHAQRVNNVIVAVRDDLIALFTQLQLTLLTNEPESVNAARHNSFSNDATMDEHCLVC